MEKIKEAFRKIKEENILLKKDIHLIKNDFNHLKEALLELGNILIETKNQVGKNTDNNNQIQTHSTDTSTHKNQIQTHSTDTSTHKHTLESLKGQNMGISKGNGGVPTDRQTDRQTDKGGKIFENKGSLDNAEDIIESLDSLKKEVRLKFKRLTDQELLVFSTLYQLEQKNGFSSYKELSIKLSLSESSIRDYIGRLLKKSIPISKEKINNKNIHLTISPNLKKIATLSTILHLRSL